ncbi:MAG: lipoprotein [Pseudomonadota bacterium]
MVFSSQILGLKQSTSSRHGLALTVLALSALAGCGQKGPLFLPPGQTPSVTNISLPQSAVVAPLSPASAAQ